MIYRIIAIILLGLFFAFHASAKANDVSPDWKHVEKRLQKGGFSKPFIAALKQAYEKDDFQRVLEFNTLLFLRKDNYHGTQVTDDSVKNIREFITKHKSTLRRAERENGVPPPIVASLLWMESRYGKNTGRFHVASVYADLIQGDRPAVIRYLQTDGAKKFTKHVSRSERSKIARRAKKKAKWALAELRAVEKIYKKHGKIALAMRGSFSGAGGLPQFLPSSYLRYARSKRPHAAPNLNKTDDAILSVAHFLHENGWKKRSSSHQRALMNYNNSQDYADAILNMAGRAEGKPDRMIASEPEK